jgi:hypothetical protein
MIKSVGLLTRKGGMSHERLKSFTTVELEVVPTRGR